MKPSWILLDHSCRSFCSMKRLGVFLLPPDGMLVHRSSFPRNLLGLPNNLPVPIYTPGWREALWEFSVLPKNTTYCPRPGLEPRPLAPGTSALTIRPLRLPQSLSGAKILLSTNRKSSFLSQFSFEPTTTYFRKLLPRCLKLPTQYVYVSRNFAALNVSWRHNNFSSVDTAQFLFAKKITKTPTDACFVAKHDKLY